jgi:hypothetical protein
MSNDDTNGQEGTDPDWESIGREKLALALRVRGNRIGKHFRRLAAEIEAGHNPTDIGAVREDLERATDLIEDDLGPTGVGTISFDTDSSGVAD